MTTAPDLSPASRRSQPPGKRGRLKIFLGYTSGVGKTFRMLDEARRRKERGEDVVVAAHQAGAQAEVRTLLEKLEVIPTLRTSLGVGLHMDAIVRRKPAVCVIDPLAQNNPAGFANARRWQDIEQLLAAGISVITAINILYIEELREQVEALTGKHTKETVPRDFLMRADEIVLVDLPEERASETDSGKTADARARAERERVLSELREMALVLAAEVAEAQLERYLDARGVPSGWGAHERFLLCITPHSNAAAMIASGKRNRDRFHGELHAIYVRQARLSAADKRRLADSLQQAREAGAQVTERESDDPVATVLEYARHHKITQIFVGHSAARGVLSRVLRGPLDKLLAGAEEMDVRIFPHD